MSTHTDEKRYLSDLMVALRLRNISGARIGVLAAMLGAFLLTSGAFAAMAGEDVNGVQGWWVTAAGAAILLVAFSLVPVDAIIDPRRPNAERYGRKFLVGWAAVAIVVVVLAVVGLMSVIG